MATFTEIAQASAADIFTRDRSSFDKSLYLHIAMKWLELIQKPNIQSPIIKTVKGNITGSF
jgi:hypothetical protein